MQFFPQMMLVDMNSFFASVEQQANPNFRGKPVGVCASVHKTSCLIAASKEAKALGIKTGTLVYEAKKICPEIILVQAEPEKYREVNKGINQIFLDYTDKVESYSIDESFLELGGSAHKGGREEFNTTPAFPNAFSSPPILGGELNPNQKPTHSFGSSLVCSSPNIGEVRRGIKLKDKKLANPFLIGAEIKRRIKDEVGEWLTCNIGLGQNKFLCKIASELKKPDGFGVVWRENLPILYRTLKLRDLWGISFGWEKRLASLGITSPLQILSYPVENLIALFGKPGFFLWQRVNGLEEDDIAGIVKDEIFEYLPDPPEADRPSNIMRVKPNSFSSPNIGEVRRGISGKEIAKSFGNSWVLNFRTTNKEKLKPVTLRLAEKAARRMRREGMSASGFYLSVLTASGESFRQSRKLSFRIQTGMELFCEAEKILEAWKFETPVTHIAVGFNYLAKESGQMTIFPDRFLDLTPVLDNINDKYGEFAIRSAMLAETTDFAPDAIAFGK